MDAQRNVFFIFRDLNEQNPNFLNYDSFSKLYVWYIRRSLNRTFHPISAV